MNAQRPTVRLASRLTPILVVTALRLGAQSLPQLSHASYTASESRPTTLEAVCDPALSGEPIFLLAGGGGPYDNDAPFGVPLCWVPNPVPPIAPDDPVLAMLQGIGFNGTDPTTGSVFAFQTTVGPTGRATFSFTPEEGFLSNYESMKVMPVVLSGGCALRAADATLVFFQGAAPSGGQYQGPGDAAPPVPAYPGPGPISGPGGPGPHGIGDPAQEHLGCSDATVVIPGPVASGAVAFGSVLGTGDVVAATRDQLGTAAAQALATGQRYVDVWWDTCAPMERVFVYPVKALQQYGIDWLAILPSAPLCGPCSTSPAQLPGNLVGSTARQGPFGTLHGFFHGASSGGVAAAWGTNTASISDLDPADAQPLSGVRLRFRADALATILADIETANPGWLTPGMPLLVLAGGTGS